MIVNNSNHASYPFLDQRDGKVCFFLLILGFFVGCLVGSLAGAFYGLEPFYTDFSLHPAANAAQTAVTFLRFSAFHLVALLLGTSYFGIILTPVLSGLRGYLLSCTAASIISAYPGNGFVMTAAILILPALISLPCFFLIALEAFRSARRIFHLVRGNSSPRKDRLYGRALSCLPFLALGTLIELKLVPYLVSLLT